MDFNGLFVDIKKSKEKDTTIIFTTGIAEQHKNFLDLSTYFHEKGFTTITYDLRGHGKTSGKKGWVDSYKDFLDDLDLLVKYAYKETKKVFLYGHSMGGVITNTYTALNNNVDGVIITASPTNILPILRPLSIIPGFLINRLKVKTNYADQRLVHENTYVKDDFDLDYFYFKMPIETMIKSMKIFRKNIKNYQTPVLLIYSLKDQMVHPKYAHHFYDKLPVEDKTLLLYKESYHNIHMDIEVDKLKNDLYLWINDRL